MEIIYALVACIQIRLYPHTFCFKTLRVHTYPDSLHVRPFTHVSENDTDMLEPLTEHAVSHDLFESFPFTHQGQQLG